MASLVGFMLFSIVRIIIFNSKKYSTYSILALRYRHYYACKPLQTLGDKQIYNASLQRAKIKCKHRKPLSSRHLALVSLNLHSSLNKNRTHLRYIVF